MGLRRPVLHNLACFALFLLSVRSVECLIFHNQPHPTSHNMTIKAKEAQERSSEMRYAMAVHGLLLWGSMGLLMPLGILVIRMSNRRARAGLEQSATSLRVLFYVHLILQMLSVLLTTAGAVMSIMKFENSFSNNHQRIGLSLYIAVWLQTLLGFCRPHRRGSRKRNLWYLVHWILGTTITIVGIINIYTGLEAYERKTTKGVRLWTILFTVEVSFLALFYLFQDKWEYMQGQGVNICSGDEAIRPSSQHSSLQGEKGLVTQPSSKANALKNLIQVT